MYFTHDDETDFVQKRDCIVSTVYPTRNNKIEMN